MAGRGSTEQAASVASSFTASSAGRPSAQPAGEKPRRQTVTEAPQKPSSVVAPSSVAKSDLSLRLHKLEHALMQEHAEHEATKAELRRTMREVECLRQLIEAPRPSDGPIGIGKARASTLGGASSVSTTESLFLR
jgi:hypothetical protein